MLLLPRYILSKRLVWFLVASLILIGGTQATKPNLISVYKCYATAFLYGGGQSGQTLESKERCLIDGSSSAEPLRTLPREYPTLSLAPMLVGAINLSYYEAIFIGTCLLVSFGVYLFIMKRYSPSSALTFLIYLVVGSFSTAYSRLDILLGGLILLILHQVHTKRYYKAYFLLAIATMLKLIPAIFLIPLLLAENKGIFRKPTITRAYGSLIYFSTCSLLFVCTMVLSVPGALSPISFALTRPLQIESIPSVVVFILSQFGLFETCVDLAYGSLNLYERIGNSCGVATTLPYFLASQGVILLGAILFIAANIYLGRMFLKKKLKLEEFFIGLLLVFMAIGKIFSPQFLLWADPLLAGVYGFEKRIFPIWFTISFLTSMIYPVFYGDLLTIPGNHLFLILTILLRNCVFVIFTAAYVFDLYGLRSKSRRNEKLTTLIVARGRSKQRSP